MQTICKLFFLLEVLENNTFAINESNNNRI